VTIEASEKSVGKSKELRYGGRREYNYEIYSIYVIDKAR